jgi:phosphonate transport system substrate-binding protein
MGHPLLKTGAWSRRAALSGALTSVLATSGCWDRAQPEIDVRLDSRLRAETPVSLPPDDRVEAEAPIRFVYASVLSPERSTLTYARLGAYLSTKLGREVEIVRRRTYAELNELLRTGGAEAGLVCTGAFAEGEDKFGLRPIAIPVIDGKRTYRSYVIVRRDSGLTSFEDLEGVTFAFTDPLSNSGFRYVAAKLHALGLEPERFFARILFTYSHDNSIEAVLDGIVDAGSVDSLVWEELVRMDPDLGRDVVVIEQSEDFPINPVVAAPATDSVLRARIAETFLSMAADSTGMEILQTLGTEAFVEPSEETLAGYRAIARSWQELGLDPSSPRPRSD